MKKLGLFGAPAHPVFAALAGAALAAGDRVYWRNPHGHKADEREGFPVVVVDNALGAAADAVVATYREQATTQIVMVSGNDLAQVRLVYPEWKSPAELEAEAKLAAAAAEKANGAADAVVAAEAEAVPTKKGK